AQEHILGKRIVEQTPSGANHSLSLARHVISSGHARSEVVQVLAVQLAGGEINRVKLPTLSSHNSEVVPSHSVVQSQPGSGAEAVLNKQAMAVLVGMSLGIALYLASAVVGNPLQKSRQAGKIERSAKIVIEHLRDSRTPEFVAELHVVLSRLPRIVVDEMPVGVNPIFRQGVSRADLREAAHIGRR